MMLQMEGDAGGHGVKHHVNGRMACLNPRRCIGRYHKRRGMKRSLRHTSWQNEREFKPWKKRWHFFSYKDDCCWHRGHAGQDFIKRSVLFRSGKERSYLDSQISGCRSLINHPACFHPDKHRIDLHVWISESGNEQEFGIACELDGVYNIDHVAENWIVCQQNDHGRWNCGECWETGDPQAEPGYVKAMFDSRQALLLDHVKPTIEAIRYLCSHDKVSVWLDCPNNPGNSSSVVILKSNATTAENWFLISVGRVIVSPLKKGSSEEGMWVYERLTAELQRAKAGQE